MAGYKIFGPGDADRTGGNLALFATKPRAEPIDANAVAPIRADGSSPSLEYMAQAAAKDRAAEAAAGSAGDQASAAASAEAAGAGGSSNGAGAGAINGGSGGAGAVGTMGLGKGLTGTKPLGELTKGGPSGNTTSASASTKLGEGLAAASQNGSLGALGKNTGGARTSSNAGRGIASRRSVSARSQLGSVMRDQMGATSSMAGGKTYDGVAAKGGSAIGPAGSAIGMDAAGAAGEAQPKSIAKNSAANEKKIEPPTPNEKHVGTAWETLVKRAVVLGLLVAGLFIMAKVLKNTNWLSAGTMSTVIQSIGVAIMVIGSYMGVLAGQILAGVGGEPGQKSQGIAVAVAALAAIATGIYVMSMAPGPNDAAAGNVTASKPPSSLPPSIDI